MNGYPPPPPPPPPNRHSAVYSNATSWSSSQDVNATVAKGGPGTARYPHIKDLQDKAAVAVKTKDPHIPIKSLLHNAQQAIVQVGTDVSFKRPDRAYVEYLIGADLLLNVIPKHKDFPTVIVHQGEWAQSYKKTCKQFDTQHEMCEQIKTIIMENNERSGIRPSALSSLSRPSSTLSNGEAQFLNGHSRPLSMPDTPTTASRQTDELFLTGNSAAGHSPPIQQHPRRERPVVQPKPEGLRDHSPRPNRSDELAERFSQLRVQRKNPQTINGSRAQTTHQQGIEEQTPPTKYTPPSSEESYQLEDRPQSEASGPPLPSKPSGPREMLPPPPKYPPPPPKIPLNAEIEAKLPRAPSPAYNPSRSNIPPLKTSLPTLNRKPSIIGQDLISPHSAKRLSGSSLSHGYSQSIFSNKSDTGSPIRRSLPEDIRPMKSITAPQLYECLQTSNVLLIDVRSREDYDQGHIFAKSIMCIEPIGLRVGLSAEELEERLIVSPETEQSFFESRDSFDLVVYHDQNTTSDRFLTGPPAGTIADALRALHDTLYEFNEYKPLRKPPLMLKGGLDAWTDLVGPQALSTSSTAALVGSTKPRGLLRKPGRPLGRVPMASANSSLEVRKRRLRDQKPLNADEKKTWLEKARKEEVDPADYQNAQSDGDTDSDGDMPPSPFVHTLEDFLRRFPEASPTQQSMMVSLPSPPRSRPPLPRAAPQVLPSIPSRPAPALPRPSYSGVSERDNSQSSPLVRQQSSAQYPLYQSRSASLYKKLPRTGLINFSVTCYMNATIQCLVATVPLSNLFLGTSWKDLTQRNWKGSDGVMPIVYANLIRSLWKDDVTAIRPKSLREICSRLNREWGADRQQDAKEFFDFLVDCLHEDLNVNWQRTPLDPLSPKQEVDRERMPVAKVSRLEWDRYTHRESSHIADIFAGQHASRLRCTTCGNTSTTYEAFYSISVEIPRTSGKRPWDIYDCLRSYCKEEKLSGDEVWKCPHCKCEREATKQITITRAPWCLVIHFKRFDMQKGQSAKKVHTPIGFPLFGLDMDSYMIARPKDPNPSDGPIEPATTPPYAYDAYAVMRHIGSSGNGGHYISLVRDAARNNIWRKFDDEKVTDFDPNKLKPDHRLQNEQAYLVFYARAIAR